MTDTAQPLLAARRRFEPYPAYKDSGIEWLGPIPSSWSVKRLRFTVTECQNGVWGNEPDGLHDIPCVRVADFDRLAFRVDMGEPTLRSIDQEVLRTRVLRAGDLLLEKSGGGEQQPVGTVVLYDHETPAVCSNFIARMPVAEGFDARFLTYLHAALYRGRVNTRSIKQSTGIQNLDSGSYLTEAGAFPDVTEQRDIAAFLDRETARIDALVAEKKRLVDLLNEQRASLITQAVTRGLDSDAPMKDSGIRWLGRIPASWDCERIKWVARMESGHTPDKKIEAYWIDGDIPWVSLADTALLRQTDYVTDTAVRTTAQGIEHSSARMLPPGTVVFSRDATIGLCAITAVPMAVSQHFIGWVCGQRLLPEYLLFVLRSMTQQLDCLTMGATVKTIGMPDVKGLVTPIPPHEEQERIVAFVRQERSRIDTLLKRVQDALDRLREYRTALISAAVTGRIDVREEVA